jgi:hypothetical protein
MRKVNMKLEVRQSTHFNWLQNLAPRFERLAIVERMDVNGSTNGGPVARV